VVYVHRAVDPEQQLFYAPITTAMRGGTIALISTIRMAICSTIGGIEELATGERTSLRTGCFYNPGVGETAEGLTEDDMLAGLGVGADITLPRFPQAIHHRGKSAGAIRASFGLVSNCPDVYGLVRFLSGFRDQTRLTIGG
jgi:selenocysteine lyase/cysteine desulfurase